MTKFIYLSDSHCEAAPQLYHQQRVYTEKLPEIGRALRELIEEEEIDFVLHGGDMIDGTAPESVQSAAKLFDFEVPVYLCLGNHDLTTRDALQQWLQQAPQFFPDGRPDFSVVTDDCAIHIVPNQWGSAPYCWEDEQRAHFLPEQAGFLEDALRAHTDRPHLLLTHSPVFGLPPGQTGLKEPYHTPVEEFTATVSELAANHRHLRCVLGAHSHLNMCVQQEGTYYITSSALVETPFECKVFEVSRESISMKTATLAHRMQEAGEYDFDKTHVQGRAIDRAFSWPEQSE